MALDPLYWLAGILEGEGTFMSGPPSRPNAPVVGDVVAGSSERSRGADHSAALTRYLPLSLDFESFPFD